MMKLSQIMGKVVTAWYFINVLIFFMLRVLLDINYADWAPLTVQARVLSACDMQINYYGNYFKCYYIYSSLS